MIITNIKLILKDEIINGSIEIEDGKIKNFSNTTCRLPSAIDGGGAWLMPGLVELHTDNLDKYFTPRPKVNWPPFSAMKTHDYQLASAGITTVLDAVALGDWRDGGTRQQNMSQMINTITDSQKNGMNRVDHYLHLRCELPHESTVPDLVKYIDNDNLKLVSFMDHSPGQRQFQDINKYRTYYMGKYNFNREEMVDYEQDQVKLSKKWSRKNRLHIAQLCVERMISMASHDDATQEHVQESHQLSMNIAEFPTTIEAAKLSHELGLKVLMGSPNVVRGGSHSSNVAAHELARLGYLDILSSDYYPMSLLESIFCLTNDDRNTLKLHEAVRLATYNPARALNLFDRGEIQEGKLADMILVKEINGQIYIDRVFKSGKVIF